MIQAPGQCPGAVGKADRGVGRPRRAGNGRGDRRQPGRRGAGLNVNLAHARVLDVYRTAGRLSMTARVSSAPTA